MAGVSDEDDWPEFDLGRALVRGDARLRSWVRRSPRRALSPSGKRLLVARRRSRPGVDAFVVNLPPEKGAPPEHAIWSLDVYDGTNWGRAVLPPGVAVESLSLPEQDRLQVRFVFDDAAAGELGLTDPAVDASLSPIFPSLRDLPDLPRPRESLRALAEILRNAGVAAGRIVALGEQHEADRRGRETKRERAEARRHASIWKAHAGRTRRDLGPLSTRFDREIRTTGLSSSGQGFADDLARLARVSLVASATGPVKSARVGASRLGGLPDLPPGTPWPAIDGALLSFILQIDLGTVAAHARGPLPTRGVLSLFMGENDSTRNVEHRLLLSARAGLRRCKPPRDATFRDDQTGVIDPVGLKLAPALSLPDYESDEFAALTARHELGDKQLRGYLDMQSRLALSGRAVALLGYPAGARVATNAAKLHPRSRETRSPDAWVSLLRVQSNVDAGLTFWDAGELDILIPRTALARRSFDVSYGEITTS
jgi:hypothetical protein